MATKFPPDPHLPAISRLLSVMESLRDPDCGCPWDLEQTFETIAPYTIEEAYEVSEAISQQDMPALRDELGDLLLQVVYHAQMAREADNFTFEDVAHGITEKMIHRHPHVFSSDQVENTNAQTIAWEDQKAVERSRKAIAEGRVESALDGVCLAYPALMRAVKLQKRAARVDFDWPSLTPVIDKIEEELGELRAELIPGSGARDHDLVENEMGDLLFACVNLARHLNVDPETALRRTNYKFETRFRSVEYLLQNELGITPEDATLDQMEERWQRSKN